MAGATRPVAGGAYTGPRSEPGGQKTPRVGRSTASYGTYIGPIGTFAQQVDQGDIYDDYADPVASVVTVSGSSFDYYESYYYPVIKATSGLVSYWRLSDPSGPAIDEQGVSNGVYNGSVTRNAPGLIPPDTAAVFPGTTSSYVEVPPVPAFDTGAQISVEAWFTVTALGGATQQIVVTRSVLQEVWFLQIQSQDHLVWTVNDAAQIETTVLDTSVTLVPGQRYHVVGTYDAAGTIKLYINGVASPNLPDRTPNANVRAFATEPIWMGANLFSALGGTIDEVALYNVALDAITVNKHYLIGSQGLSDPPGIFDTGSGIVTASGSGTESYVYTDTGSGTVTASGGRAESYNATDARAATVTASGTGTESYSYTDARSGTAVASTTAYSVVVLTDGPHAYWRGSIPVPPTIDLQLADQTGRGNYLRLYHASPAQDTYPKDAPSLIASDSANPAMDFIPDSNAWRDSGSQGPDFSPTTAMSLELWCKPRAGALSGLVQHDLARKAGYYGLIIEYQAGNYVFAGLAADGTNSVTRWVYSPSPVVVGTTYHVVLTLDTTNLRLYVNGTLVGTQPLVGTFTPGAGIENFAFGQWNLTANGYDGILDEVSLYHYALTSTQVQGHYAVGTASESIVYNDSGTTAVTASGTGTESYSGGTTYTDARTGTVTASGGGTETASYADTSAGTVTASGTAVESRSAADATSGTVTASGSSIETFSYTDARTATTTTSGSGTESYVYTDTRTITITVSGSGTESYVSDTTAPIPTVTVVDVSKISRVIGKDVINVTFTTDEAFVEYEIRRVSSGSDSQAAGNQVETAVVSSRTSLSTAITDDELVAAAAVEGNNTLKVFVKDVAGNWST